MNVDPSRIKETLLVDEDQIQEQMLNRVKAHLGLDAKGKTHVHRPTTYGQKELILLHLIGIFYAFGAKLRSSDSAPSVELVELTGISSGPLSARLAELRKAGKIESVGRGESRIVVGKIPWILNEIESAQAP